MAEDLGFHERMQRIESLTDALDGLADPTTRASARELVEAILEMHGAGLARIVDVLGAAGEPGRSVLDRLAEDGLVGSLLLLHGSHPVDATTRVQRVAHRLQPHLDAQDVRVEVLTVEGGIVSLRTQGPWEALRRTLEDAIIEAAPDVTAIRIEEGTHPRSRRVSLPIIPSGARP